MKLYDLPRNSKLRIELSNTPGGELEMRDCTFHRIDGMYSYCTIDGETENNTFHLLATTPMVKVGEHYEIEPSNKDTHL